MLTAVRYSKNAAKNGGTRITSTLFDVIIALQEIGVDDKDIVLILERMITSGYIRFGFDGAHSN